MNFLKSFLYMWVQFWLKRCFLIYAHINLNYE